MTGALACLQEQMTTTSILTVCLLRVAVESQLLCLVLRARTVLAKIAFINYFSRYRNILYSRIYFIKILFSVIHNYVYIEFGLIWNQCVCVRKKIEYFMNTLFHKLAKLFYNAMAIAADSINLVY